MCTSRRPDCGAGRCETVEADETSAHEIATGGMRGGHDQTLHAPGRHEQNEQSSIPPSVINA